MEGCETSHLPSVLGYTPRVKDKSKVIPRRKILKLAGVTGASLWMPFSFTAGCGGDGNAKDVDGGAIGDDGGPVVGDLLPVPPMLEGEVIDGVRVFKLDLQTGMIEWVPGNPTETYGVNGPVLGPTLHLRKGESVRIEVTNSLNETSTIHWHGMELPARSDGGPYQPIEAGATWVSEFDVIQRPLMAWYHPHHMHQTARHVYMGMAGLIYIDDPAESLDLPSTYGIDDLPLVVQDRRFAADGTHPYSAGSTLAMPDRMAGLKGETMLVNGVIEPTYTIQRGLIRLRILNGSNARNYNFGFSDNRSFQYIGNDGGLFDAPIPATRVLLAPAERAEILVDFSADTKGDVISLQSYSGEVLSSLFAGNMGANLADALDESTFAIMSFEVGDPPESTLTPPTNFAPQERLLESDAVRTRSIVLSMGMGAVFINGEQMTDMSSVPAAINFNIPAGDVEIWEVSNASGMAHPLHLHNRHFQVLDIDGESPPAYLAGWKDTVLVKPGQDMRLLVSFAGTADSEFPYMFHCHILEHEDAGMMGQFYLV